MSPRERVRKRRATSSMFACTRPVCVCVCKCKRLVNENVLAGHKNATKSFAHIASSSHDRARDARNRKTHNWIEKLPTRAFFFTGVFRSQCVFIQSSMCCAGINATCVCVCVCVSSAYQNRYAFVLACTLARASHVVCLNMSTCVIFTHSLAAAHAVGAQNCWSPSPSPPSSSQRLNITLPGRWARESINYI